MRILFLIHRLPCPPDGGSKLRAHAALTYLAERHDVWCAGMLDVDPLRVPRPDVRRSLSTLRSLCREVIALPLRRGPATIRAATSLLAGSTATESYFQSSTLRRRVHDLARRIEFDAVLAFSSSMAPLALEIPARRRVLDLDDFDSRKWSELVDQTHWPMNMTYRAEARRLVQREHEWLRAFDASVVVNRRERELIEDESLRRRLHVIEATAPSPHDEGTDSEPGPLPAEPIVGFVGAMDYPPNIDGACWFADAVWPRILARRPDAEWWLIGRNPGRAVRQLHNGRDIHVTGTVESVVPYLDRTRVSVAPLRMARGVQIKVLTAMLAARPCVVTSCVADGLDAWAGRDLVVANSSSDMVDAVVNLLDDDIRAEAIGRSGRAYVEEHHETGLCMSRLEQLLCVESCSAGEAAGMKTAGLVSAPGGKGVVL